MQYKNLVSAKKIFFCYGVVLLGCILIGVCLGAVSISLPEVASDSSTQLIFKMRLTRLCTAALVGALLAMVGAVLQKLLRNPLADPFILGISAGGTVLACSATLMGLPFLIYGIPVRVALAFLGCLATLAFILLAKKFVKNLQDDYVIPVIGLILNSFFGAILMLIIVFAKERQSADVYTWMLGSLQDISFFELTVVIVISTILLVVLLRLASAIKVLSFNDELAKSLGFNASKIRTISLIIVAVIISITVSISGTIGFVGLIIPHLARKIHKGSIQNEWMASAFLGAILLVISDIFSRTLARPAELPIGMFTAILGAPALTFMLLKKN